MIECTKTYQQQGAKEAKQFWERKEHKRKAECINNMEKELYKLKEESKVKIHFDSL